MRKVYDPETRAAVVSALLTGQGVNQVARAYSLPASTVSRWRKEARTDAGRSDDVGELLLAYLRESLATLRAQAAAFRDPAWLRSQDAGELAVLHGVTVDKAVRLLTALEASPLQGDGNGAPTDRPWPWTIGWSRPAGTRSSFEGG